MEQAEGLQLQKMVVTPELVDLMKIEMQARSVDRWDGHLPQVMRGAMPFLDHGVVRQDGITMHHNALDGRFMNQGRR